MKKNKSADGYLTTASPQLGAKSKIYFYIKKSWSLDVGEISNP
jgi:hypothetical protein